MAVIKVQSKKHGRFLVLLDDTDYEKLKHYGWYVNRHHEGYFVVAAHDLGTSGRKVIMHKLLMNPPKGMVVDHINRNPLDNRRSNLRIVTRHQNALNIARKRYVTTPYIGVSKRKRNGKYQVQIIEKGITYLAYWFDTAEEAKEVHRKLLGHLIGKKRAAIIDSFECHQN